MLPDTDPFEDAALLGELRSLDRFEPPLGATDRFRARLRRRPWQSRRWQSLMLAASMALALIGYWRAQASTRRSATALAASPAGSLLDHLGRVSTLRSSTASSMAVPALREALRGSTSANVRVSAVHALAQLLEPSSQATIFREALKHEDSPFVQAAIVVQAARLPAEARDAILAALRARTDLDTSLRLAVASIPN